MEKKPEPPAPEKPVAPPVPGKAPEEKTPEEKKPEHHSALQFEFKKPTLVVNYSKFQNASLSIGSLPLKAPETHHLPEQDKPAPAKSFKVQEKLHLDVKIDTAKEFDDVPFISLNPPEKAEKKTAAPARKSAAARPAPKKIRSRKPLKLQVRVSTADPAKKQATEPDKPAPAKKKAAPAKKASSGKTAPDKKG